MQQIHQNDLQKNANNLGHFFTLGLIFLIDSTYVIHVIKLKFKKSRFRKGIKHLSLFHP